MMLAPVGLTVYSRLSHLKKTVDALCRNRLAAESRLFVFSDAPRPGDEEAVDAVRRYLRTIEGFHSIDIIERETNSRIANNRGGMRSLLDRYGRMIWLEEDIVTAPGFLDFMNGALDFYQDAGNIVSVTGYAPPITLPAEYRSDAFCLQRFNAWGFGIWKDRFDRLSMGIDPAEYRKNMKIRSFYRTLVRNGPDIPGLLDREVRGEIDALDVKIMYQQVLHDWYTIHPRHSLVQNIGHDGSGTHCVETDRFYHDSLWSKSSGFEFPVDPELDDRIVSANRRFRRLRGLSPLTERLRHFRRCYV